MPEHLESNCGVMIDVTKRLSEYVHHLRPKVQGLRPVKEHIGALVDNDGCCGILSLNLPNHPYCQIGQTYPGARLTLFCNPVDPVVPVGFCGFQMSQVCYVPIASERM